MSVPFINFLVNHTGACQMSFSLAKESEIIVEETDTQVAIFYEQLQRPCSKFSVPQMLLMEAWAQPGVSIATSLSTAHSLLSFPGPHAKIFYMWDMSWIRNPKMVGQYSSLFRSADLRILARCQDHATILKNNFNIDVGDTFDNFEHKPLLEVVEYEYNRQTK